VFASKRKGKTIQLRLCALHSPIAFYFFICLVKTLRLANEPTAQIIR
jgi:hypothetical protein